MIVSRTVFANTSLFSLRWFSVGWIGLSLFFAATVWGQEAEPASDHAGMTDMNPAGMFLMDLASGTAANPASWQMPMVMMHFGKWNTMFMGVGFLADTQQSGPRGGDKLYGPNWF